MWEYFITNLIIDMIKVRDFFKGLFAPEDKRNNIVGNWQELNAPNEMVFNIDIYEDGWCVIFRVGGKWFKTKKFKEHEQAESYQDKLMAALLNQMQ